MSRVHSVHSFPSSFRSFHTTTTSSSSSSFSSIPGVIIIVLMNVKKKGVRRYLSPPERSWKLGQATVSYSVFFLNIPVPLLTLSMSLESHMMPRKDRSHDQGDSGERVDQNSLGKNKMGRQMLATALPRPAMRTVRKGEQAPLGTLCLRP